MDARYPSSLCQEPPPECPGHLRFSDGIFKVLWVLYLIKCASSRASFRARNKSFGGRKNLAEKTSQNGNGPFGSVFAEIFAAVSEKGSRHCEWHI